ncbi:hypothetical protein CEXT_125361 [Caerostris extrusa]|uniref:Uncharacterized protein n=1 Tax=Caerostris extrusa TaxID=172846 RepID=A0AAV4SQA0_CAEEX|nr:hypothetical protein CEXT_125361 [Caerostris extrusa]
METEHSLGNTLRAIAYPELIFIVKEDDPKPSASFNEAALSPLFRGQRTGFFKWGLPPCCDSEGVEQARVKKEILLRTRGGKKMGRGLLSEQRFLPRQREGKKATCENFSRGNLKVEFVRKLEIKRSIIIIYYLKRIYILARQASSR